MFAHLTPTELVLFVWYRRLRVCSYIGTAADLYTRLTGRLHPGRGVRRREVED